MYSKDEMKVLNKVANAVRGCDFDDLDFEDQDEIYCIVEDNGLFYEKNEDIDYRGRF